ncbi:hypothetical protein [Microbacterium paraoxydans]|uniref:hypothetical protein n=1 Tax=Microbacterium paraoxydans TaxID=199592 RepID=UPI001CFBEAF6|nr:hypothetical protein [Microbacterium paraoxydans]
MSLTSPSRGYPLERIAGDIGTMSATVDQVEVVLEHLRVLRGASGQASGLPGRGQAVTAVRSAARDILSTIGPHVAVAQTLSTVLTSYAKAHDEHATRANALIDEIAALHATREALSVASDEAGRAALAASWEDDPVATQRAEDAAADLITERRRAQDDLDDLWGRYEFHFGAWDEAYDAAIHALCGGVAVSISHESRDLLEDLLAADTPRDVLVLWFLHPGLQEELIEAHPAILGGMDGLPVAVRVTANQRCASAWIDAAQEELDQEPEGSDRAAFLEKELAYLRLVRSGDVQLYLYDRDFSRIVEVIGDLATPPERVLTYVPGTFTSLADFYTGSVQEIGSEMVRAAPGTVAFVYKDGLFPGEDPDVGGMNLTRIGEANDPERAADAGRQLARFASGMRVDPALGDAEQDAFGFSWGLANVTSSEVAGAEFDKVVSLAGAGMPPEWTPDPDTIYADLSYRDVLQEGQHLGVVWGGNNPRLHPAFEHGDYYTGPDDDVLDRADAGSLGRPTVSIPPDYFRVLTENHSLISTDDPANEDALRDMRELVKR